MWSMEEERPKVGTGILVVRDSCVLLGRRKTGAGAGCYGTPGGHVEYGEESDTSVLRELKEECGEWFRVSRPEFLCVVEVLFPDGRHYFDIAFVAYHAAGEAMPLEPDKTEPWEWHPINKLLPTPNIPLMPGVDAYLEALHTGTRRLVRRIRRAPSF